jgi:transcriptional regulator of acetoin/glycerol metabolism
VTYVHPHVFAVLLGYHWPGNIRQLENVIQALAINADNGIALPIHIPEEVLENSLFDRAIVAGAIKSISTDTMLRIPISQGRKDLMFTLLSDTPTLRKFRMAYIRLVVAEYKGSRAQAAKALGVTTQTVYNLLGDKREE